MTAPQTPAPTATLPRASRHSAVAPLRLQSQGCGGNAPFLRRHPGPAAVPHHPERLCAQHWRVLPLTPTSSSACRTALSSPSLTWAMTSSPSPRPTPPVGQPHRLSREHCAGAGRRQGPPCKPHECRSAGRDRPPHLQEHLFLSDPNGIRLELATSGQRRTRWPKTAPVAY